MFGAAFFENLCSISHLYNYLCDIFSPVKTQKKRNDTNLTSGMQLHVAAKSKSKHTHTHTKINDAFCLYIVCCLWSGGRGHGGLCRRFHCRHSY